jgi:hypothetical protein
MARDLTGTVGTGLENQGKRLLTPPPLEIINYESPQYFLRIPIFIAFIRKNFP